MANDDPYDLWISNPGARPHRFISVGEASFLAGKSENTIRSWFHSGKVQGVRIGGTIWILRNSLENYFRSGAD